MVSLEMTIAAYVPASCLHLSTWQLTRDSTWHITAWLLAGKVSRLVLAITSKETREVIERWQFDVALESETQKGDGEHGKENEAPK
jgi:hypothetical protein